MCNRGTYGLNTPLQNFPNTTRRFAARGILENFEISLAVLLPNTTTGQGITYTNGVNVFLGYNRLFHIRINQFFRQNIGQRFNKNRLKFPRGLIYGTNMVTAPLFRDTNMAAVTSCPPSQLLSRPELLFPRIGEEREDCLHSAKQSLGLCFFFLFSKLTHSVPLYL